MGKCSYILKKKNCCAPQKKKIYPHTYIVYVSQQSPAFSLAVHIFVEFIGELMFVTTKAKVFIDNSGSYVEMPVLMSPSGVVGPLFHYCFNKIQEKSISWMKKTIFSVKLFFEYIQANPKETDSQIVFRNFSLRLHTGTFNNETGLDDSWLCWSPRSPKNVKLIIANLSNFFDWINNEHPKTPVFNPRYSGSPYDQQLDKIAYLYRRSKAFLGHNWAANPTSNVGRKVRSRQAPKIENGEPPAFPEDRFEEFLFNGFKTRGRQNYRNMLITLLLHGAGFRASEPFHLYISDVHKDPINPLQAKVLIHHPMFGKPPKNDIPNNLIKAYNRKEYLSKNFGLLPRSEALGKNHSGWKGGMHDASYYKVAHWFTPQYGEYFLNIWYKYLEEVALFERNHPFAFINLSRAPLGAPYTLSQYNKAHAAACHRIGIPAGKQLGTTPHGHRHAYGRRLCAGGLSKDLIRRCMHHSSINSQDIYIRATTSETLQALSSAAKNIENSLTTITKS
ncbi:Integrase family protein [Halomonas sp. A3H3]|nr:Integrase family protein [Halomonas sp. A3H3]